MENAKNSKVNKNGVWDWNEDPINVTKKTVLKPTSESTHVQAALLGGFGTSEPAYKICIGCMRKPNCVGCMRRYGR